MAHPLGGSYGRRATDGLAEMEVSSGQDHGVWPPLRSSAESTAAAAHAGRPLGRSVGTHLVGSLE